MVSDDVVEAYARDGVVVVRGLMTSAELEQIAAGMGKAVANRSSAAVVTGDETGVTFEDVCRWAEIDELGKVALRSGVPRTAAQLMDSPTARFYFDHILVKEATPDQEVTWRQDMPLFNVLGRGISAWIPVDRVAKQGSPEFWAGSHLGPWRVAPDFLEREAKWFPDGTLAEVPDIEADPSLYDIRRWELDPGDVVFYDFATVHTVPGVVSEPRRRVLTLRYLGSDARYSVRPWKTAPDFPGLARDLAEGAEMEHAYFPMAWPR